MDCIVGFISDNQKMSYKVVEEQVLSIYFRLPCYYTATYLQYNVKLCGDSQLGQDSWVKSFPRIL